MLDDDRVKFYLRNRDQIEQWAALRVEAASAMDEWLGSLAPEVQALADRLSKGGPQVIAVAMLDPEGAYPKLKLTRPAWQAASGAEGGVSVCLEWQRARTTLYGALTPYVGIHAAKSTPVGVTLRQQPLVTPRTGEPTRTTNAWWAALWRIAPPRDFPAEQARYRQMLIEGMETAWEDYAERIDRAVAEPGGADRAIEPSSASLTWLSGARRSSGRTFPDRPCSHLARIGAWPRASVHSPMAIAKTGNTARLLDRAPAPGASARGGIPS